MAGLERLFRDVILDVVRDPSIEEVQRLTDLGLGTDSTVVAAAIEAGVDYFCTGDKRLRRRLDEMGGIKAVSPAELLDRLRDPPQ
jgi:rRNA-processing protein FCF1